MLSISARMRRGIMQRYTKVMQKLPAKKQEVERYLAACDEVHALCLQFLYGFLPLSDAVSFGPEQLGSYVTAALYARQNLSYGERVPAELFLNYVLMPRVNNEYLDMSRGLLQEALWQRIQDKSMQEAALEVNYWCCEHVTYHPSDNRTLAPGALMRSTMGRCGEESTFTVAALRSVGIPARQCYVPRWSHCDDNHAWVELWISGRWHYLGACEPEPVLDKGWFTAAASRAMVVHSRALSDLASEKTAVRQEDHATWIHSTDLYADCTDLRVRILDHAEPVSGVRVQFQLVNESQFFTVYETETDNTGTVVFHTGKGDLWLQAWIREKLLTCRVDTRQQTEVLLDLCDARTLAEKHGTAESFDLVPPSERPVPGQAVVERSEHRSRLAACDAARGAYTQSFRADLPPEARGNWAALEKFLDDGRFSSEEQVQLLSTLRPKDYLDCTAEMLSDTLACAREYKDRFDPEIYQNYILAPRVANEMLLPVRSRLRALRPEGFGDGQALWSWLTTGIQVVEDGPLPELVPDCAEAMTQGYIHKSALGVLFVNLCRSFGIPARQNPNTLDFEWFDGAVFCRMGAAAPEQEVPLRLLYAGDQPIAYGQQFTLGRFREDRYQTLCYDGLILEKDMVLEVPPGEYVLVTTTRQIDGTLSVRVCYETIRQAAAVQVILPEDQTARRIRQVSLQLPVGPIQSCLQALKGRAMVLFLEPGKEPTEHLLQELLECQQACSAYALLLLVGEPGGLENHTLKKVQKALPHALVSQVKDEAGLQALRQAMGIGDERLPLALALDEQGRGLYASANYNIHTVQTLIKILETLLTLH